MKPIDQLTDDDLMAALREAARLPDAPPALVARAVALFAAAPAPAPTVAGLVAQVRGALPWLRAQLGFDSWASAPLAAGLRGAGGAAGGGAAAVRQLVFSTEGRDIDLRIAAASPTAYRLSGQLLGPDDSGRIELQVLDGAEPSHACMLDALGEFALDGVPPGDYRLLLQLPDAVVELTPLHVGPEPRAAA